MKATLTKITMTLALTLLALPAISQASAITLENNTRYPAQFVIKQGDIIIAKIPTVPAGAKLQVPTDETFVLSASTNIDENTYVTAPIAMDISRASDYSTRLVQNKTQGTYEFVLEQEPASSLDTLRLRNTMRTPVRISFASNGRFTQSLVMEPGTKTSLSIEKSFKIFAVINGVTTDVVTTHDAYAKVTAVSDDSSKYPEMYDLIIN
ncbi:MAG TPA: hypothetical protein VGE46_08625 [Bdellovibrio sp.]